ncbi:ER to Golgi transport protein Yif1 [Penicillium cosmopolitanum]|uniref:Protein YIF1 n=1 Tax=Penicillium cosmopolitanum TaxID=1131564 RepID=A0A9W9VC12_9EURO|nr:ER to Golgi transport protein Yif1 [Penicillium cosmopolitanum]KAJ5376568.1 ER to Golgi transport protein Yif1 [Penicillium cosmopolitanum]
MYRGSFAPPPAQSPPLHHPIPQHVSTVPMMRSPPPPSQQTPNAPGASYGGPYQPSPAQGQAQGQQGQTYDPGFGGFINDPTAQMGFQVGKSAMMAGQEYMEQNFNRYVSIVALKHYFNVSNSYVLSKLALVLFPWRHKPWSRQQARMPAAAGPNGQITQQQYSSMFLPPRDDLNSPRYVHPRHGAELLGSITTTAIAVILFEILCLKMAMYILAINNDSQLLDLVAYSGYKFVGIIVTLVASEILTPGRGRVVGLLRSLKYVLLPDSADSSMRAGSMQTVARGQRNRRTQFLFVYSYVIQFVFMWVLSREGPSALGAGDS